MGKKGKWLSNLKKAFSPNSKNKGQRSVQLKEEQQPKSYSNINFDNDRAAPPLPPELNDVKLVENTNEQNRQSYSVLPPAGAAEPSVSNAQITNEVDFAVNVCKFSGKSKEEVAAVMIQTAFRGYLARRALGALKGLMRLKSLMEGPAVKRQAANTLRCMQTVTRVQSQIYKRRIRMLEENQALQRQLLQKHAKELEAIRIGEEWDDSLQSREQIQANLLSKYEAAMRRERALAYAFSHQQTLKSSLRAANPMFMNSGCPSWGWSWLERWTSAHPWDSHSKTGKEPHNNNHSSVKNASLSSLGGEISKSYARYQLNSEKLSLADGEKPLQKGSTSTPSKPASLPVARKLKSTSPRSSIGGPNDDSRSIVSVQSSVRERRHSIPGSSVRDDESLGSSHGVPSYMVPTKSAKAKSRSGTEKNGTPEKEIEPLESVKKRLSFPPSPARPRHHSRLPKLERNTEAIAVNNRSPANGKEI